MELDPPYCDVIVQRYEQFTGEKAKRIPASSKATTSPEKTPAITGVRGKVKK